MKGNQQIGTLFKGSFALIFPALRTLAMANRDPFGTHRSWSTLHRLLWTYIPLLGSTGKQFMHDYLLKIIIFDIAIIFLYRNQ